MAHQTVITFESGLAVIQRGKRKTMVTAEFGRKILRGEATLNLPDDAPEKITKKTAPPKTGARKSAVVKARLALGYGADDPRVTECPEGPCDACGMTGILYES